MRKLLRLVSLCLPLCACGAGLPPPEGCADCTPVHAACTLDRDCAQGLVCNSALQSCTECAFDAQCADKPGTPACDPDTGACVACNLDLDCVKALGRGYLCDAHTCTREDNPPCAGDDCPECSCDVASDDGTWCDDPACAAAGEVCDAATLRCRKKRQDERCVSSSECGDLRDPTIGACIPAAACVYSWHEGGSGGACSSGAYGRCGVACDDLQQDLCTGSVPCPEGSRCRQASTASGAGTFCVSASCTK